MPRTTKRQPKTSDRFYWSQIKSDVPLSMKRNAKRPRKSAAQLLNESVSEAKFQEDVRDAADRLGWKFKHDWSSEKSVEGWPDCFLLRGSRSLVLELKTEKGQITQEQREWLAAFNDAHIEAWVVRPSDWDWLLEKLR